MGAQGALFASRGSGAEGKEAQASDPGGSAMAGGEAEGRRGPGRSLSALLGRSKKQKFGHRNGQKLQEKALHILSCHQNLGDLLQEVGSPLGKKALVLSNSGTDGRETSVPDLLVVSALQDQAAALGVPVGILSARTAAQNVEKISAESSHSMLLKGEQRAIKQTDVSYNELSDFPVVTALFSFSTTEEVVLLAPHFEEFIYTECFQPFTICSRNVENAALWIFCLADKDALDCHAQAVHHSILKEICDFAAVFLRHRFQKTPEPGKKLELQKLSKICCAVLERMLAWVLDSVAKEKQEDASTLKAVKRWLCVFTVTAYQGVVHPESLQEFFSHTLAQVLTYNPQLKVSDAICLQREWSFARTSTVLTLLYRKLFVLFKAEELIHHLQEVLETSEVNWHHILSCVSTLLVCHSEAESLIKDLLGQLLKKAFENYDLENMMTAFLIARQAALEGPAIFMPYSEWFKVSIEDMGLYEDLSSPKEAIQLPETPDSRMALIDSLKRVEKIPPNMYATYIEECRAAKEKLLQELPAQIAHISEKLAGVLGHMKDEDEAVFMNLRIQLNLSVPETVDLLLTSFCKNVMSASYFLPPERDLSVTELWDYFLACQTGESVTFCMKFCTAALSYFVCKFASLPHDHLCTLLHPGFVKKLQYVVPRLCVEARDTGWEGSTDDFPWRSLSHLNLCYSKAALCLWKQTCFKALLQEKVFQLTLQEWLLLELGVHPDEDVLSAAERQEFHYWALYQHYLPLPATAGGCDGDLQMACAVLIDTILDFCQRSELGKCNHPNKPKFSTSQRRGNPEIYSRLQEMLLELELERRRASPAICRGKEECFLFRGLLSTSLECDKPAQEVTAVFTLCQARCPIILSSAAGLQSLRELQASVNSFLSSESASLVADIPWLSAAFLNFTVQQQMLSEKLGEVLERLGPGTEQLLMSLLFFSVMDFISTRIAPQEGVDVQKAVDWSAKVLQHLQEQGMCWLSVFSSAGPAQSPNQSLRDAVSDQHLKLLPIAFYSLLFTFDSDQLTREPQFLHVAIDMYTQLLQLFMDGTTEEESSVLIRKARQFLLCAIPQCPQASFSNLQQLLDLCGILDPEIKAALVDFGTEGDLLDEEPLLF
ncbi:hypothetical protein JD844_000661 [Phrynosoma platyrhinos]|uniref:Fanconi anemia group A protein n=1 Tax=Phrynosoma platyrhinos TaxID=52577 RepID=A0ABQ7SQW6_PHRPL|nr:hypothetical protein JD844_000661 [Phrynosoma platyrhinos]